MELVSGPSYYTRNVIIFGKYEGRDWAAIVPWPSVSRAMPQAPCLILQTERSGTVRGGTESVDKMTAENKLAVRRPIMDSEDE